MIVFGKRASADSPQPDPEPPPLPAQYLLPDGTEGQCEVTAIDPDMALFLTAELIQPGVAIIAFIEELGRVDGVTGPRYGSGFWVDFTHQGSRRARFIRHLRWLIRRDARPDRPVRRHTRFEPLTASAQLHLPGGFSVSCELLDVSLSGAALRADIRPMIGSMVVVGRRRGRVIRHFAGGFAIEFLEQLADRELQRQLR
ncbi:PilZ domain-containing protein [Aestuariivirga sp.]|uniref:PilZ domain-containing protein n=1 Tax=Aestuariivirga sp. TaxID=2650926 RepID=UPI00378332B2